MTQHFDKRGIRPTVSEGSLDVRTEEPSLTVGLVPRVFAPLPRRYLATQVEQQIGGRRRNAELANHAHNLSAMQRRMIGDVLHLIDKFHRVGIAAEKFEW